MRNAPPTIASATLDSADHRAAELILQFSRISATFLEILVMFLVSAICSVVGAVQALDVALIFAMT
jgi:hypothetical protein